MASTCPGVAEIGLPMFGTISTTCAFLDLAVLPCSTDGLQHRMGQLDWLIMDAFFVVGTDCVGSVVQRLEHTSRVLQKRFPQFFKRVASNRK